METLRTSRVPKWVTFHYLFQNVSILNAYSDLITRHMIFDSWDIRRYFL